MKKQYIILSVASIIIALGGLYLFTDMFLSPEQKFINELEHYEDLRYDTAQCRIDLFILHMNVKYMNPVFDNEVSREELRVIASRNTSNGYNWQKRDSPISSDDPYAGLSYDNENLILWVYEYNTEINSNWMVYWWSPK